MTKVTPFETWSVTLQNDTNKGIKFEEDPRIVVEFKTTGILSTPPDMNPALAMSSSPSIGGTLPSTSPSPFPSVNLSSSAWVNPIYVIYSRTTIRWDVILCRTLCVKGWCTLATIVSINITVPFKFFYKTLSMFFKANVGLNDEGGEAKKTNLNGTANTVWYNFFFDQL